MSEILSEMEVNNWDEVGFRQKGEPITSYLCREDMAASVAHSTEPLGRPFSVTDLSSPHTPIRHCLRHLLERKRLFILGSDGVDSIVTVADLQKQPVRMMLFASVSLLEMAMLAMVRRCCPDNGWITHLSPTRVQKAKELHELRRGKRQDIDLADCLQLTDKVTILLKSPGTFGKWGFASKRESESFFRALQTLRDNLAHSQDPANGGSWNEVSQVYLRTESLIRTISQTDASES